MLAEHHKQQLTQAVAAAQQQECVMHSQQFSAEAQAQVTQIQAQHQQELQAVSTHRAVCNYASSLLTGKLASHCLSSDTAVADAG